MLIPCIRIDTDLSDLADLVQRISDGDRGAEADLVRMTQNGVRFVIRRRLGDANEADVDDLADATLMEALGAIRSGAIRIPAAVAGYIRTIAIRKVSHAIAERVHARRLVPFEAIEHDLCTAPVVVVEADPKQRMATSALASLSSVHRELIRRFYLDEQSKEQICRDMNLTESQFRNRKSRAIERMATFVRRHSAAKKLFHVGAAV